MESNVLTTKENNGGLGKLIIPALLGVIILITSFIGIYLSFPNNDIVVTKLTTLSYASLILFIVLCLFSLYATNLYFTFLIFILLAFPSPVNDFFPGAYMGNPREADVAIFPFFTHIDLFIGMGLLKAILKNNKIAFKGSVLFLVVISCMFISIFVNFFYFNSSHELLLLIQGLFQFRYLVGLYLLLAFYDISLYKNNILIGFVLSVIFLFFESFIYSYKIKADVLSSGSLANNVFASIIASILLFFFFVKKRYPHSFLFKTNINIAMCAAVVIIIATGARMAILAFFVTYFLMALMESHKKRSLSKKIYWALTLVVFIFAVVKIADHLPKRYNPHTIIDRITVNKFSTDLTKFIKIERSWETNSLITRLELYTTSINMFRENVVSGIGVGRWDILKSKYGFKEFLLIDSHNGYLSIISQYGLLGLPLLFFIYIFPILALYRNVKKKKSYNFLFYLALINFYISIADLSNSGIFKHQIFSLLAFNAICLLQLLNSENRNGTSLTETPVQTEL